MIIINIATKINDSKFKKIVIIHLYFLMMGKILLVILDKIIIALTSIISIRSLLPLPINIY